MTDLPTQFIVPWNYKNVLERETVRQTELFKDSTKEEVLAKLIELTTAVHGIHYTLSSLDSRGIGNGYSRGCVYATSELFPDDLSGSEDEFSDKVYITKHIYDDEGKYKTCDFVAEDPKWDGTQKINKAESLSIPCTTYVDDKIAILEAHESAMAAYVGGGCITYGDVRLLGKVLGNKECVLLDSILKKPTEEKSDGKIE